MNVTNLVSSIQKYIEIEVLERITFLKLKTARSVNDPLTGQPPGGTSKNIFPLDYDVVFTVNSHDGSNVMFAWDYGDGSSREITNSSILTKSHRFSSLGAFTFTLTASNVLDNYTVKFPLLTESAVLGLSIRDNSPRSLNENTTFEITFTQFGTKSAVEIDFGDGHKKVYGTKSRKENFPRIDFTEVAEDTKRIVAVHTYTIPREYLVNITAANNVSRLVVNYKSVLLNKPCKYPKVEMIGIGGTPATCKKTFRSQQLAIFSNNVIDCQASRQTIFIWKVFQYHELDRSGTALDISANRSDIFIPKRSLPFGTIKIMFTVRMGGIEGVENTTEGFICVWRSPLIAKIEGGSGRSVEYGSNVTINGASSEDPDVGPGIYSDMSFMWLCRKKNESFPQNVEDMLPIPLQSSHNASLGGCFGSGLGPLNVSTPSFKLDTSHLTLADYVIELRIQKGERKDVFSQRIEVVAGKPPSLLIQ